MLAGGSLFPADSSAGSAAKAAGKRWGDDTLRTDALCEGNFILMPNDE
jgi:hypothetical protein